MSKQTQTILILVIVALLIIGALLFYFSTKNSRPSLNLPETNPYDKAEVGEIEISGDPQSQVLPGVIDKALVVEPEAFYVIASETYEERKTRSYTIAYRSSLAEEELLTALNDALGAGEYTREETDNKRYLSANRGKDHVEIFVEKNNAEEMVTITYIERQYEE